MLHIRATGPYRVDDAYITFSFSKNLATGNGPIFSNGVRVEGYSNFLWMALNALPLAFNPALDVYLSARILTVPFLALLLLATYALARVRVGAAWAYAALLLVSLQTDMVLAFLSGMETLPYAALLTVAFACQSAPRGSRRRPWALPLMTAAALMRIDGFLPLLFLLACELLESRWDRRLDLRRYLRWALPWVAIWAIWFSWRWWYYGLPLPSTYYAKALLPRLDRHRGWDYAHEEFVATGVAVALPFLILLAHRRVRPVWMLLLFAVGHIAYVIRVGGDWMPFARFFIPIVPIGCVLCVWAVADLAARVRGLERVRARVRARAPRLIPRLPQAVATVVGLVVLGWIAIRGNNPWGGPDGRKRAHFAMAVDTAAHVANLRRTAELLDLVVPAGQRLVTDYAGVFAYYTDAQIIDMWGLCNATIATRGNADGVRPMYGRTCHACYPELRPDYFHTESPWVRSPDAFESHALVVKAVWQMDGILRYLDVVNDFRSGRILDHRDGGALFFLERRDAAVPPQRHLPSWASIDYPFGI